MLKSPRTALLAAPTFAAALALLLVVGSARAEDVKTYEIDKSHSNIIFKIRHLLSKTAGQFHQFAGTVTLDPDKRESVKVEASIDVASIDTDDKKRDDHLRGPDFFDAEKFPKITFSGGTLSDVNADRTRGKLSGTLTMHGVSKPVVLDAEWFGTATDPWGNRKAAFAGKTVLNRKDFGIVYNKALDNGGYLIGDEVEIEINIEAQIPKAE